MPSAVPAVTCTCDMHFVGDIMIKIYGIKNCDTMKKAFTWLDERNIPYAFHDY